MKFRPPDVLAWRLPAIETWPAVVAFVQTWPGRLLLFAAFAGLMKLIAPGMWIEGRGMWLLITIAAAVVSVAGRYRHLALLVCTGALLARAPDWIDFSAVELAIRQQYLRGSIHPWTLRTGTLLACVPLAALSMVLARNYRNHPLGCRPVFAQHVVYLCLLVLAASHLLKGMPLVLLWSVVAVFSAYFWYLAYALIDQRHRQPQPMLFHFASFSPFYSSTVVPVGKGAAGWRSVEAGSAEELAVTQLKALKLLAWALILKQFVLWVFRWGIYQRLGVSPLRLAFEQFLQGGDLPASAGLLSIFANFPERLLIAAIGGHVIVATARLAGFRLLRNTWRPLSSRSIAEFWNRYIYYFKEVLVHVYFYPTYLRWFKRHPRLRVAFATFMAAGVGNFIFHFMENSAIVRFGLLEALVRAQTYAFYCAVLATGIILSQLRTHKAEAGAGWWRRQFLPSLGVAAFFCFLSIFDGPQGHVTLVQHFSFLWQVLGMNRWIRAIG